MMPQKGWYKGILHSISVESANVVEDYGTKEFFINALKAPCQCKKREMERADGEMSQKRLKYTCPIVSEVDKELIGNRKAVDVRKWVLTTTNFKLMKLVTKHKCHMEPHFNFIHEFGDQMFKLCSSSIPDIPNRLQNVFPPSVTE